LINLTSSGSCSLILRGNALDFDVIGKELNFPPTRIVRAGQLISKVIEASKHDIGIFEVRQGEEGINDTMDILLTLLQPHTKFLNSLSNEVEIYVKCYIQSEFAQIGMTFLPEIIGKLATVGLKLEISIFSWGGAEDK
jgi:hypothetical protein